MPDDYLATTQTAGRVSVRGTAAGSIESRRDQDWFAVELEAGREYRIDLRGSQTGDGTLGDPYLRGIHDAEGNPIPGTSNDDRDRAAGDYNSQVTFTATETGTHYIAAGAYGTRRGTYELEVREVTPESAQEETAQQETARQETADDAPAFGQTVLRPWPRSASRPCSPERRSPARRRKACAVPRFRGSFPSTFPPQRPARRPSPTRRETDVRSPVLGRTRPALPRPAARSGPSSSGFTRSRATVSWSPRTPPPTCSAT